MERHNIFLVGCIVFFGSLFHSCDNSKEILESLNVAPAFILDGVSVTSVSDSMKLNQIEYDIRPELVDSNANVSRLLYDVVSGGGNIYVNGVQSNQNVIDIVDGDMPRLSYRPSSQGRNEIEFSAKDGFGATAELEVILTVFDNIQPIAFATASQPVGAGSFERLIDASESRDPDQNFGGGITAYEFVFLGVTREISSSSQIVIFPSEGTFQVVVRVKDNDNVYSAPIGVSVTIEQ